MTTKNTRTSTTFSRREAGAGLLALGGALLWACGTESSSAEPDDESRDTPDAGGSTDAGTSNDAGGGSDADAGSWASGGTKAMTGAYDDPFPLATAGCVLAVAVTEDARRVAARLRLTNAEARALDSMGHRWWRLADMDEARARRRLYRLGEEQYRDRLLLAWARSAGNHDAAYWREFATLPQRWSAPKFPLKAADFIARGIAEGPALGHVLTLAEDAWLAADFPLDPSALSAIADATVGRFTRDHRL